MQLFCIRFGKLYVLAYPQPNVGSVVVGPEHVVDVEYDGLPGDVEHGGLIHLLRMLRRTAERQPTATIHGELVPTNCSSCLSSLHKSQGGVRHPKRPDGQLMVDSHLLADSLNHLTLQFQINDDVSLKQKVSFSRNIWSDAWVAKIISSPCWTGGH